MAPRESAEAKAEREAQEAAAAALADAAADSPAVDDADKGGSVKVEQADGEIVLTRGVDVVLQKTVKDGVVKADNADELAVLLGSVPGAKLVD